MREAKLIVETGITNKGNQFVRCNLVTVDRICHMFYSYSFNKKLWPLMVETVTERLLIEDLSVCIHSLPEFYNAIYWSFTVTNRESTTVRLGDF